MAVEEIDKDDETKIEKGETIYLELKSSPEIPETFIQRLKNLGVSKELLDALRNKREKDQDKV